MGAGYERFPDKLCSGARVRPLGGHEFHRPPLAISAATGAGLEGLRSAIREYFAYPLEIRLVIRPDDRMGAALNWLHERTQVVTVVHRPDRTEVVVRCRPRDRKGIEALGRVVLVRDTTSL